MDQRLLTSSPTKTSGFTLVEVLVAVTLTSLIVLALMAVFNGTQSAFRAGLTQIDVLESGRETMDLIASDLRLMSPSLGASNAPQGSMSQVPVNFYAGAPSALPNQNLPLTQPLIPGGQQSRTYALENIFILSLDNQTWTGVGYVVDVNSFPTNTLYRFSISTNATADPTALFNIFISDCQNFSSAAFSTNMSRLMDGVVELRARAFDVNGGWMTNQIISSGSETTTNNNVYYLPPSSASAGETGFYMFSNTLPAAVEIEMGALEDRTLQHVESLPSSAQLTYLTGLDQAGKVHIFRQRVSIPNVDPSAYQ